MVAAPIPSLGLQLPKNEIGAALNNKIEARVFDVETSASLREIFESGILDKLGDHAASLHDQGDIFSAVVIYALN